MPENVFTDEEILLIASFMGVEPKVVTGVGWLAWCKARDLEGVDASWANAAAQIDGSEP